MKNFIPTYEELLVDKTLARQTNTEPNPEWLNELPFELNFEQINVIKDIFSNRRKTQSFIEDESIFNAFIQKSNALIRKYHSIKTRSVEAYQETDSIAKITDWLKDLKRSQKSLEHIDQSKYIAAQLQRLLMLDFEIQSQNAVQNPISPPRPIANMVQDIAFVIEKLDTLSQAMKRHVKTGRPKVDPMRSWFILELSHLYGESVKLKPVLTRDDPFEHLVSFLLQTIGDPIEDVFAAMKKALKSK